MRAKTPFSAETSLPAAVPTTSASGHPPARPLSAAFAKALGGKPSAPHLEGARSGKNAPGRSEDRNGGATQERIVPVKQIAPRKGHR